jgi:hypothetical protein
MTTSGALERGRQPFGRSAWGDAYACLTEATAQESLSLDDLERLALAAALTGHDDESADALAGACQECVLPWPPAEGSRSTCRA